MKGFLTLSLIALAAMAASAAFDADAWLEKRRQMTREALRLHSAYTNCVARLQSPAEDVSVCIETYPDGSVKTTVFAKRAQFFLEDDLVWAEGVVLKKFDKEGVLDAQIDADNCVIDRASGSGWAEGRAKVTQGKTVFAGKCVFFSSPKSYVKVFFDTDMESRDLKMGGLRP